MRDNRFPALDELHCSNCGILFGMPQGYLDNRRNDKASFFCPNGHSLAYTESEADKLRRERDRLKQQIAQRDDEISMQRQLRDAAEKRASAQKGVVTRLKNRAAAGVCPCCNRSFENLRRHMATKHADFIAEAAE